MNPTENKTKNKKESRISKRGFGSLSTEQVKIVASRGGKKVSANREHMAEIGRKGGLSIKKKKHTNQTPQSNEI